MFSPYEELEYLSDYLPDEGESVLVTRESGELVCKPVTKNDLRDGVDDAELYGFLVRANEQLHGVGAFPIWICLFVLVALALLLHGVFGVSWHQWFVVPGVSCLALYGCFHWIRCRQREYFRKHVMRPLAVELSDRGVPYLALIAGVRQHGELRTLLDELVRWTPDREFPLT